MGVTYLFDVNIDGYAGVLVAAFILFAGYNVAKDTLSPLLGQAPDPELVESIEELVMSSGSVIGMHDLVVHDYGPGRVMISLHAEVDGKGDIFKLHDEIDLIERRALEGVLAELGYIISMHDFRMVAGPSHTNLIFDVVIAPDCSKTPAQVRSEVCAAVEEKLPNRFAVVNVDTSFVK